MPPDERSRKISTEKSSEESAKALQETPGSPDPEEADVTVVSLDPNEDLPPSEKPEEFDPEKPQKKEVLRGWKRYLGMTFALGSSIMLSLLVVVVKYLKDYHVYTRGNWTFLGLLGPSLLIILRSLACDQKKVSICEPISPLCCHGVKLKTFFFLFLRAILGCGAVLLQYKSLTYLDISDSTVIVFSTPVFVTFLARVLLGEKFGVVNVLSAIMTLVGVTILTRPTFLTGEEDLDMDMLIGAGFAFGCMICTSLAFLTLRVLRDVHFSVTTFFFGFYGSMECLMLSLWVAGTAEYPRTEWDWLMSVLLGLLMFGGQTCLTLACQWEEAGPISLVRTCDVIFSFVWQFLFFGVSPDLFSYVGSVVVMSGVVMAGFRKYLSMLPEGHRNKRRFWLMLK